MAEVIPTQAREQPDERCSDCGIVIEKSEDRAAICELCGQPLCRNCASAHATREEAMICGDCWESESLSGIE